MRVCVLTVSLALMATACADDSPFDFDSGDRIDGSGEVVVDVRSIGDFTRIVLAGEGTVALGAGQDGAIEIETDDNLLELIETERDGDTLTIRTREDTDIEPTDGVTYRLGCPEIVVARLSGAGTIDLHDCIAPDGLDIDLDGAGAIVGGSLAVTDLEVTISGAGEVELAGRADAIDVRVPGSGAFDGRGIAAVEVEADISGSGSIVVGDVESLDVSISGTGSVEYSGDPDVTESITGSGSVNRR